MQAEVLEGEEHRGKEEHDACRATTSKLKLQKK